MKKTTIADGTTSAGTKDDQGTEAELSTSAPLPQNRMLGAVSTPDPVSFLEWVSSEGYIRLSKDAGHKWFKIGNSENYTTTELYENWHSRKIEGLPIEKMIIDNLCVEYSIEEATEQVKNAEIIVKSGTVKVIYDNGKSDLLKLVTTERLELVWA